MKKPRSDSKLDNLEPETRVLELRDGLMGGWSHEEAKAWLWETCQVTTSGDALTRFWRRHCAPLVAERRRFSAVRAEALGDAMEADPVNWDAAIVEKTKQLAFEFLEAEEKDADAIKKLLDALMKARRQELDERKVAIMEAKARKADEAEKVAGDDALTAEEKQRRLKGIFGMG